MLRGVKWVDEIVPEVPYAITEDFMRRLFDEYQIDCIVHRDNERILPDGSDAYALPKMASRYKQINWTSGVSSSDIVCRISCTEEKKEDIVLHRGPSDEESPTDGYNHSSILCLW